MNTLSYRQPWALLVAMGIKPIENRTWKLPEKHKGKRVLIHAGMKYDDNHRNMERLFTYEQWNSLSDDIQKKMVSDSMPLGAIIGSVVFTDCVINHESIWAEKSLIVPNPLDFEYSEEGENEYYEALENYKNAKPIYNWVCEHPILFSEPIPVKGKLSFWDFEVPEEYKHLIIE